MENNEENNLDEEAKPGLVFLLLLDGWGVALRGDTNAISLAKKPNLSNLIKKYPAATLEVGIGKNINTRYLNIGCSLNTNNEDEEIKNDLTKEISLAGLRQLKIFESERMVALTYYFNGRREDKLVREEWLAASSEDSQYSSDVSLSLKKIIKESIKAVKSEDYNFIVAACPALDLVASSGDLLLTAKMLEDIDKEVRQLFTEVVDKKGTLVISSAGGNAEKMVNLTTDLPDNNITDNPVPLVIAGTELSGQTIGLEDAPDGDLSLLEPVGGLSDIGLIILKLLKVNQKKFIPEEGSVEEKID